jgi:transposase
MARPSVIPPEDKTRLVLSILAGELSVAEAARRAKVSEQSVSNWKRQFIESGRQGVAEGGKPGPNARERALLSELEEVKAALGEAHVELRVWKKAAEHRLPRRGPRDDPQRGGHAHHEVLRTDRHAAPYLHSSASPAVRRVGGEGSVAGTGRGSDRADWS